MKQPLALLKQQASGIKQSYLHFIRTHKYTWWFPLLVGAASVLIISSLVSSAYLITHNNGKDNVVSEISQSEEQAEIPSAVESKDDTGDSNEKPDQVSRPGSEAQNSTGVTSPNLGTSGQVSVAHVSSGGKNLKTSGSTSVVTASISPQGGGMLLVWVGTAVGGEESVIVPSISGLNLDWSVVKFSQKKDAAPRALTLFKARLPANPGSGQLTIHFNTTLTSSHWFWEIDRVSGTSIKNIYERVDGGFLTDYSMTLSPATTTGNVAIAGMLVGNNDVDLTAGPGLTLLGSGGTNFATVGSAWTNESRGLMNFIWNKPAHCLMVAIEVAL